MKNLHQPNCDESERYALQLKIGKLFVERSTPFATTPDPEKAKQFSGLYLNTTKWDWMHDCEALPIKETSLGSHFMSKSQSRDGRGVRYRKRKNRNKVRQRVKNAQDKLTNQLPNPALSHLARFESQIPGFLDL